MTTTTTALDLHETFRAYVIESNRALRVFVDYKTGHATEREVEAANRREREAADAHIAAMIAAVGAA